MTTWRTLPPAVLWKFAAVLATRFLASAASMMVAPYLVVRFTQVLRLQPYQAVLLASVVVIGGRLFSKPVGAYADRYPGVALSLLSLVGAAVSTALLLLVGEASNLAVAALACIGLSLSGATFTLTVRAFIVRIFSKGYLTLVVATSSVIFNLGMFAGATAAGLLLHAGQSNAMIVSAVACYLLAACVLGLSARSEKSSVVHSTGGSLSEGASVPSPDHSQSQLPRAALEALSLTYSTTGFLVTTVSLALAAYCAQSLGSAELASIFYSTQSLALVAALPLAGLLTRDAGVRTLGRLYFLGQLFAALGFVGFGLAPNSVPLMAVGVLALAFGLSQMLSIPTADPLLSRLFGRERTGKIFGAMTSASAKGALVACGVNAATLQWLAPSLKWMMWAVPGVVAAIFVGIAAIRWFKVLPSLEPPQLNSALTTTAGA